MIVRFGSLLLLLYALGFILFAVTLGRPAAASQPKTDAAVVITGGSGRIEHGVAALKAGKAERLLVAGLERDFEPEEVRALKGDSDRDLTVGGPGLAAEALRAGLVDET